MQPIHRHLSLFAVLAVSLALSPAARAEEKNWIDLTLDAATAGSAPPTAPFDPSAVNHSLETITVTPDNKLEVATSIPGFTGPALRFTKDSEEPRSPKASLANSPGLLKAGKVRFTWEAEMNTFTDSAKFPGFEALLTFGLMDSTGKPFYNLYYLVGADKTSGTFGSLGQKIGSWTLGAKQQFEVVIDLDAGTAAVKIDGVSVGTAQKITATDGLRVVQFTDGTGLASYGGKFSATLAHFKMASF